GFLALLPLVDGNLSPSFSVMSLAVLDRIYRLPGPQQVTRLNAGVKADVFAKLASAVDVTASNLATALGLSPRTLRSRMQAADVIVLKSKLRSKVKPLALLTPDETERGFRVYRVLRRATEVLGSAEAARSWMNTPQKALGEKTPLSLLARDVGTEEVLNVLTAVEYGVYL
ncbi:MAG: DUF2384 domain-containing protein, partial [Sulfuricaulis sp.]|nr:DUF2384 domain-containing protein [Sulfuricaulis sp.]